MTSLESMAIEVCPPTSPDVSTDNLFQLLAVVQPLEQVAYFKSSLVASS